MHAHIHKLFYHFCRRSLRRSKRLLWRQERCVYSTFQKFKQFMLPRSTLSRNLLALWWWKSKQVNHRKDHMVMIPLSSTCKLQVCDNKDGSHPEIEREKDRDTERGWHSRVRFCVSCSPLFQDWCEPTPIASASWWSLNLICTSDKMFVVAGRWFWMVESSSLLLKPSYLEAPSPTGRIKKTPQRMTQTAAVRRILVAGLFRWCWWRL